MVGGVDDVGQGFAPPPPPPNWLYSLHASVDQTTVLSTNRGYHYLHSCGQNGQMSGDKNMEICWRESGGGSSIEYISVPSAVYAFSVLFAQHPLQWIKR